MSICKPRQIFIATRSENGIQRPQAHENPSGIELQLEFVPPVTSTLVKVQVEALVVGVATNI